MAKPEWMPQRLYQWVKPRSLLLHLAFVVIASGCLIAGWWQVNRAMQGNGLSYLYSIEWPAFAVVAGIGWWQMVHDTPEDIAARTDFHRRMREASAAVVARTLPRSALAVTVGSQDVVDRAVGPASRQAIQPGQGHEPAARATGLPVLDAATGAELVPAGATPAVRDGIADTDLLADDEHEGQADEMTEYNRYLAMLAVKGKPKTWRNPRGL